MTPEMIVFVDEAGVPTGKIGPKLESHTAHTKLHLAFSCYIFREGDGRFLLTQRALSKKVWPGVWTNSVCGHPAPGESIEDAIQRRARQELGLESLRDIKCLLPNYRYTTPPFNGIIENEFCPVFTATTSEEPRPNPEEAEAFKWITWQEYEHMLTTQPEIMSYWAKDQFGLLSALRHPEWPLSLPSQ